MIDINKYIQAIHIKWVKHIIDDQNENWQIIPKYYFNKFGTNLLVFKMNIDSTSKLNKIHFNSMPIFYQEILKTWTLVNNIDNNEPKMFKDIRSQIIWGNKYIQKNNRYLYFENWIKSDIITIEDIIDNSGTISKDIILQNLQVPSMNLPLTLSFDATKDQDSNIWKQLDLQEDGGTPAAIKRQAIHLQW